MFLPLLDMIRIRLYCGKVEVRLEWIPEGVYEHLRKVKEKMEVNAKLKAKAKSQRQAR